MKWMMPFLADIAWRPIFNDPQPWAWAITAAHFIACWLCILAGRRHWGGGDSRLSQFWFLLAGAMLLLGMNKQLDLQTLLTMWGRQAARQGGWYAQRRTFQAAFVVVCAAAGLTGIAASFYFLRGRFRECGLAYLGIVFLLTFVVMRAASFHHVDVFLYHLPIIGNWMNAGLEFGGSMLVGLGALFSSRRGPSRANPR